MEWCKLYATFATDPKVIGLTDKAFRRYVEALCYSTLHETDGLAPMPDDRYRRELLDARLLDAEGTIHNYTEFNPSKAELARRRQETRERVTRYRERTNALVTDEYASSNAIVPTSTSNSSSGLVSKNKEDGYFVEFYEESYPRREGRGAARTAWAKAVKHADPLTIIAGAVRFKNDPNREDAFTPHPATWLNHERWTDDPLPPRNSSLRHQDRAAEIIKEAMREQAAG
jgi:hypothetical protein